MHSSTYERLLWYISTSSRDRLHFSLQSAKCLGMIQILLEILETGFFSNYVWKSLTIVFYSVLIFQVRMEENGRISPLLSSFIIGETLNLNLVYCSYFVYPRHSIILSQISGFVMIFYQGYLCTGFKSSFLLSLKQTAIWAGTGVYFNKLQINEMTPFITSSLWLLILSYQATFFEYLKESDILQAKLKVKNANEKISSMLETLKDFIIVVGKDERYLFRNSSAISFTGNKSLSEFLSSFNYCQSVPSSKNEYENVTQHIIKSFSLNLGSSINFGLLQNQDFFIELEGKIILWDGELVLMLVGRNVSKLINLEQQNMENSYKTVLINIVSHELRTPISSLLSLGTLVLQSDELSSKNEERLKIMMGSCEFQLCLINDLLDYGQFMAGCLKISSMPFNFYGLLSECFAYIEPQLGDAITLVKNIEGVPDSIVTDPNRLKQILLNLLNNARKFTIKGLISLKVRYEKPKLIISCIDSGIGISEEKIPALFKAFSKLKDSQGMNHQGVGLGLVISDMLVKALGGEGIEVESHIGIGSTFSFYIKVREQERKRLEDTPENSSIKIPSILTKNIKLLLVDDNYFNILAYLQIFKSFGINCKYAMNGEQAINMIKEEKFSCILMDCDMPILDGWETTKKLYKLKENKEIKYLPPILGATGYSDNDSINKCLIVGMNDVIPKPCPQEELFRKINYWVSLKDDSILLSETS